MSAASAGAGAGVDAGALAAALPTAAQPSAEIAVDLRLGGRSAAVAGDDADLSREARLLRYAEALLAAPDALAGGRRLRIYAPLAALAAVPARTRLVPLRTDLEVLDETRRDPPALHHALAPGGSVAALLVLREARASLLTLGDDLDVPAGAAGVRERVLLRAAARWATCIALPSDAHRDRAEAELGVPREQTIALPPGSDSAVASSGDAAALAWARERFGLPEAWVVWLGADLGGRAGAASRGATAQVAGLLRIAERVPLVGLALVERGRRPVGPSFFLEELGRVGLAGRVRVLDGVSAAELSLLCQGARAVVLCGDTRYPADGVVALGAGAALVAADVPVHREVLGDGARLVDLAAPAAVAEAVEESARPERRAALATAGRALARELTWPAAVRRTLALYERLADAPAPRRELVWPRDLVAVVPGELLEAERLLREEAGRRPRRVLVVSGEPGGARANGFRIAELCRWHEAAALVAHRGGPDADALPLDAELLDRPGQIEALAELVGAGTVVRVEGGDGRVEHARGALVDAAAEDELPLPDDPERLTSHPRAPGHLAFRLATAGLPGFPGELRSVWLGRRSGPHAPRFRPPDADLARRALVATEGADRGLPTLLLLPPAAVTAELLDGIGDGLGERAPFHRSVLPLEPAAAVELEATLRSASRTWLAGVLLADGDRVEEALAALRRSGVRVCLHTALGAGGAGEAADARALAREVLRVRALGADDVLAEPAPGAAGVSAAAEALLLAAAAECRRRLGGEPLVDLQAERLEREAERERRPELGPRLDDGHGPCRAELRVALETHRRESEVLGALVRRLERSLERALAATAPSGTSPAAPPPPAAERVLDDDGREPR